MMISLIRHWVRYHKTKCSDPLIPLQHFYLAKLRILVHFLQKRKSLFRLLLLLISFWGNEFVIVFLIFWLSRTSLDTINEDKIKPTHPIR